MLPQAGEESRQKRTRAAYCLIPLALAVVCCAFSLQFFSFASSQMAVFAAWGAILSAPWSIPGLHLRKRVPIFVFAALLALWFSGFDTPYHWDAVQTAIRARAFWETGFLERISPFYVVLSPIVAIFPDTSIPSHLFVMVLGLFTIGAIGFISARMAGRTWGLYMALISAMMPIFFILYRWVVLDSFFLLMWMLTLAAVFAWSRNLNAWKLIVVLVLTGLTVASKEMGAMILFPVGTGLVMLAPREKRRARLLIVAAIVAVVVPVALFSILRWAKLQNTHHFFRGILQTDRGVTFIPFNPDLPGSWVHYLAKMLKQYVAFWAQMGLIVPAVFALWRPRIRLAGWIMAGTGAALQGIWMLIARPDKWLDIWTFPFFNGNINKWAFLPYLMFFLIVLWLWVIGAVRLRVDRKSWVILAAIIPGSIMLLTFMKASLGSHGSVDGWLQWNYPIVLVSGGVFLAAKGLRNASRYCLPHSLKIFCLLILMATIMNGLLHGTGMALRFRVADMARQEAYEWMRTQPERIVYTHWPFIYESPGLRYINFDNGALAWRRDGWQVCSIRPFADPSHRGAPGSFVLFDIFRNYLTFSKQLETTGEPAHSVEVDYWRLGLFNPKPKITNQKAIIVRRFPNISSAQPGAVSR